MQIGQIGKIGFHQYETYIKKINFLFWLINIQNVQDSTSDIGEIGENEENLDFGHIERTIMTKLNVRKPYRSSESDILHADCSNRENRLSLIRNVH